MMYIHIYVYIPSEPTVAMMNTGPNSIYEVNFPIWPVTGRAI